MHQIEQKGWKGNLHHTEINASDSLPGENSIHSKVLLFERGLLLLTCVGNPRWAVAGIYDLNTKIQFTFKDGLS